MRNKLTILCCLDEKSPTEQIFKILHKFYSSKISREQITLGININNNRNVDRCQLEWSNVYTHLTLPSQQMMHGHYSLFDRFDVIHRPSDDSSFSVEILLENHDNAIFLLDLMDGRRRTIQVGWATTYHREFQNINQRQ